MRIINYFNILLGIQIDFVFCKDKKSVNDASDIRETSYLDTTFLDYSKDSKGTEEQESNSDKILFVPTKEWQEVKSFHKLPPGLHIRINLQTRVKEAKILSEDENDKSEVAFPFAIIDSKTDDHIEEKSNDPHESVLERKQTLLRENIIEALKNIKNEVPQDDKEQMSGHEKGNFRSYDALKEEFKDLNLNIESDFEIMTRLMLEYNESDDRKRLSILDDLEFLLHQIDNAVNFVDKGGLKRIIRPGLNSTNHEIQRGVLTLLGVASQSNPKVQIAALKEGFLNYLLRIVANGNEAPSAVKAIFALSCLVRGFPYGQLKFIESGGLHILRELFSKHNPNSLTLQLKVVNLIEDLLEERMNAEGDRRKQLSQIDLVDFLVEDEWCSAISSLLPVASFDKRGQREDVIAALGRGVPLRPDHDMVHKVVSAMSLLAPSCKQSFFPSVPLLQFLKETYSELAYKERFQGQDGFDFFQNLANQIRVLLATTSSTKEEL